MAIDTLMDAESWPEGSRGMVLLTGAAASIGRATGWAHVLTTPDDMRFARDEILVLPGLQPVWWPLFSTASAIVAAQGAILSPAATLAREYGLPMVVGVPNAIQGILTGQRITVDGERGLVCVGGRRWEF